MVEDETTVDDGLREALTRALKDGRAWDARRLILGAHTTLGSAAALADEVVAPVMRSVGHGWSVGDWDVYQEHQASQIVSAVVGDLIARYDRASVSSGPVAFCSGPAGDLYTLAILLGELTLREIGWEVRNLGPNLPLRSLSRAIASQRPRLAFLSVAHLGDPIGFVEEIASVQAAARAAGTAFILGGCGLAPDIRNRLDDVRIGERMADLADFARKKLPDADGPSRTDARR